MSTNRLVISKNAEKKESQSALTSALMNANEVVVKMDDKKDKKEKK